MGGLVPRDFLLVVGSGQRVHLGAPAGASHELRGLGERTVRTQPRDELSNAAGSHHVVTKEPEGLFQPLGESEQIRCGVLMEEVDAQSCGKLAFIAQCEERQVHRVVVFVRRAVARRVRALEGPLIEVSGDAEAETVGHRLAGAALPLLEGQQRLAERQRGVAGCLWTCGYRSVFADDDGRRLPLEECFSESVRRRRTHE